MFRVTEAWFSPGETLELHTHDRSIVAVMLDGSFDTCIGRLRIECTPTAWWTEPMEELHENHIGTSGAHAFVVQPDPANSELFQPFSGLLSEVRHGMNPHFALGARKLVPEIRSTDPLAHFVIESELVLLMTSAGGVRVCRERRVPKWLGHVRDMLHAGFRERLDLGAIARSVDITPWHLARAFRQHFSCSAGEYARAIRAHWALGRLAHSEEPIARVALESGYADQSHFTRVCSATTGRSPIEYRRACAE